jgi:predicted sulfurtransferase
VLLFYRYFLSPPSLPSTFDHLANDPNNLSSFHKTLTTSLSLKGKIRVAKEGFNITVGGSPDSIQRYIEECVKHWSFAGLGGALGSEEKRKAFFKPSPGCSCVFGSSSGTGEPGKEEGASVRICEEITPMGVASYIPRNWDAVETLSPAEFHARLQDLEGRGREHVLVDIRNHYESRIGYFVDPRTGEPGLRPGIRRFGQWPQFVKSHLSSSSKHTRDSPSALEDTEEVSTEKRKGTQFMTYCTGGIRCEKGSRFLAENLALEGNIVCTLHGGIQAYLMWMDEEIKAGRKTANQSLFKGRNYVFDARGSTGLMLSSGSTTGETNVEKVASCHVCGKAEDRLSKCRSRGCHLILVVCEECEEGGDPRCCESCLNLNTEATEENGGQLRSRQICECEREREFKLWGDKTVKKQQPQGRRKGKKGNDLGVNFDGPLRDMNIHPHQDH